MGKVQETSGKTPVLGIAQHGDVLLLSLQVLDKDQAGMVVVVPKSLEFSTAVLGRPCNSSNLHLQPRRSQQPCACSAAVQLPGLWGAGTS